MRDIHDRLADLERRVTELEGRVGEPPPMTLKELDQARAAAEDDDPQPEENWPVESEHGSLTNGTTRVDAGA